MTYVDCYKYIGNEIDITVAQNYKPGFKYLIYNPVTNLYKIIIAGPNDISHHKHRLANLKYYVYQGK